MIKDYFGLSETPFTRYVPPANLYRGQAWQELSARLDHAVRNRALGVITGEVGAGKFVTRYQVERPGRVAGSVVATTSRRARSGP